MKRYYLKDDHRERGPFLLDDLKYQRIHPATLVRIDNGPWEPIAAVPDLHFLVPKGKSDRKKTNNLIDADAPAHGRVPAYQALQSKRSARIFIVLAILIFLAGLGASLFFMADR